MKKIAVLAGRGISSGDLILRLRESFTDAAICPIDAAALKKGVLDARTIAFFLPGINGENSPYHRLIGLEGNGILRRYVEKGGIFTGICAGANYASRAVLYDPPWDRDLAKRSAPGLNFFNGLAIGPLPGAQNENGAPYPVTAISVSYGDTNKKTMLAYGNGPALYPQGENSSLEIIARYDNAAGSPIAIAAQKTGKGLAFFIGPLPYIGANPGRDFSQVPALERLMRELASHERGRQNVWNTIVSKIKGHAPG